MITVMDGNGWVYYNIIMFTFAPNPETRLTFLV